jgi:hypothetical protein
MTVTVVTAGSDDLERYFRTMPEMTARAMRLAINGTAKGKGMSAIKTAMLDEVAFPNGYLNADRLRVTRLASDTKLEAAILGRKRATSLARFVTGNPVPNSKMPGGVSVRVKSGRTTYLKNAFVVRLNKGASLTEDNFNLGLAVRLKAGEQISNKRTTHQSWLVPGKVALLYGPSVDQVFSGVITELQPKLGAMVAGEFYRQFERLSNG